MAGTQPRAARVIVFVAALVLVLLLTVGSGFLLGTSSSKSSGGALLMGVAAGAGFTVAPVVLGSWLAFWNPHQSTGSQRIYRRLWVSVLAVEVVSAALIIGYAALEGAPGWIVVVFIVGGAALLGASFAVGNAIRRSERAAVLSPVDDLYPLEERRRDIRRLVLVTLLTVVVVGCALIVLDPDPRHRGWVVAPRGI
ncbi:hypothetical protein RWH43_17460 [Microbacterium sp. KSW2-21]|uniref:Uncharacterized protein n=1 Tax=Microbacterium algihabitans TaxID=3075992 RepID=A0ABU3S094_9MICO|nr:hypothetical protein [Microbacterium sp. KSW2-21]MDU0328551.1 hypothetical protein [Microbacterium sp. KSW2-21]